MPITVTALLNYQLYQQISNSMNDHMAMKDSLLAVARLIQFQHYNHQSCNSLPIQTAFSACTQLIQALNYSHNIHDIIQALSFYQTNMNCLAHIGFDDNTQAFLDQTSCIPGVKTTINFPDGQKYEGQFQNGKAHGMGIFTWPDGQKYEGSFQYGRRSGLGTYTWQNEGAQYTGEFQHGHLHGHGTLIWQDGTKYEGVFQYSQRHGKGTYTWPNGIKYEGFFMADTTHSGITVYPDNKTQPHQSEINSPPQSE